MPEQDRLPFARPEEVGMDPARLNAIGDAMQRYIDREKASVIISIVARKGRIVFFDTRGYLDLETRRPAGKDTVFRMYSNTKALAAVTTLMLCEKGILGIDDPVSRFIPAFRNPLVVGPLSPHPESVSGIQNVAPLIPASREITLRDCLCNTTGLATPAMCPVKVAERYAEDVRASGWDMAAMLDVPPEKSYRDKVEAHGRIPLSFEPGTDFLYHAGYPVIGVILEQVTGKNLDDLYRERIFAPLGMDDTAFYLDEKNLNRFADCYVPAQESGNWYLSVYDKAATSEKVKGPKRLYATGGDMGGVLSTAGDFWRFAQMLLNKGELDGVRLLSRKSVEMMTANHTGDLTASMLSPGFGFGLGVGVYTGRSPQPVWRSPGTFGWGGAAGTNFFADPKEELTALCLSQTFNRGEMPGTDYQETFERMVYQALL